MNDNWSLALTNITAWYPLTLMARHSDWWSFVFLLNVTCTSFFFNLFEWNKPGFYWLNTWDIVGLCTFLYRFTMLYVEKYGRTMWPMIDDGMWMMFLYFLISVVLFLISEHVKYNTDRKNTYVLTRCTWNFSIFTLIGLYYLMLF